MPGTVHLARIGSHFVELFDRPTDAFFLLANQHQPGAFTTQKPSHCQAQSQLRPGLGQKNDNRVVTCGGQTISFVAKTGLPARPLCQCAVYARMLTHGQATVTALRQYKRLGNTQ